MFNVNYVMRRYVKNMSINTLCENIDCKHDFFSEKCTIKSYYYLKCRIRAIYVVTSFIN